MSVIRDVVESRLERLLSRGRGEDAVALARRFVGRRPKDTERWDLLLTIQLKANSPIESRIANLEEALRINPEASDLAMWYIQYLEHLDRTDEAREALQRYSANDPDSVALQLARARLTARWGDWEDLRREFRKAVDLLRDDTDPRVAFALASGLLRVPGCEEDGLRLLEQIVDEAPLDGAPYLLLALNVEQREPDRAARLINEAREQWGRRPGFDRWVERYRSAVLGPDE